MAFEKNKTLFGHDPEERIVAAELSDPQTVTLFRQSDAGLTDVRAERFEPYLWTAEPVADSDARVEMLSGDLPYRCLVWCADWGHFTRLRLALRNSGRIHFAFSDPAQQFLAASGKTHFKGMNFGELRRLQLTVDDGVIVASAPDGWEERIEHDAAARLNVIMTERDPDVIEGHHLFKKLLPSVVARAKNAKVKLTWGRDGSVLASRSSRIQVAEKTIDYPKFKAFGRHLVDTFLLAQFYDVSARALEGFELDEVARHFHLPEGSAARQVETLATLLSGSYFEQAKIFPFTYQDVTVRGSAAKIDALLLREYLRQRHSIPELPEARAFEGGYTDVFFTGIARDVWHCDVASLYPSVMLRFGFLPASDQLGLFRGLLTDLRRFRLEAKARLKSATGALRHEYNALQSTFKILINSFYGYLGFAQAHFADFEAAALVTQTGRDLLRQMVAWLVEHGAQVIEIDTDGIYFVPPAGSSIDALQQGLAAILPEGIEIEFDARYDAMFSYKAKNYALLGEDGSLAMTGGALRSRGLERFQRVFMEETIRRLMAGKRESVADLHREYEEKIRARAFPIEFLMKTDTLQDSLTQYAKKISGSSRNRAAAYELALASGRKYQPGDQVSYYITGVKKNVAAYENSKLASDFDPQNRDENVEYYVAKLNELVKKFAAFIAPAPQQETLL